MLVKDKIYIDLDTEYVNDAIFSLLTYENPEYFQKMNMGLSVWNVPETIKTWQLQGRELQIMRGEALKIKPYFGNSWSPQFDHKDHPVNLRYVNNDIQLDHHQEGAVAAMKQYRQGIIHAVTSAGKSWIICKAIAEIGQRTLIVVHRKILMEQLLEDIDKYIRDEYGNKIKPGIIGGGKNTIGPITIGIDKSIAKNLESYREEFGTVILDECHLAPATTISAIINGINSRNRYGLTGTLRRKDQKEFLIYSTFGQIIFTIGKDDLLAMGRVVPVEPKILVSDTKFDWDHVVTALAEQGEKNPTMRARHLQEQTIAVDPVRNSMILDQVKRLYDTGEKTIVLSRYVQPCYDLQNELQARFGIESGVITGKDAKEAVASYQEMKQGDSKVIFATIGCVSTGVSISDLKNVVLISPMYTNELLLHQIRGRLMRMAEGKTHGTLYYVYDQYIFSERKLKKFLQILQS